MMMKKQTIKSRIAQNKKAKAPKITAPMGGMAPSKGMKPMMGMKKGGAAKKPGLAIMIAIGKPKGRGK